MSKPRMPGNGNTGENQDQPSPISVLDPPFEEDDISTREPSGNLKLALWGKFSLYLTMGILEKFVSFTY